MEFLRRLASSRSSSAAPSHATVVVPSRFAADVPLRSVPDLSPGGDAPELDDLSLRPAGDDAGRDAGAPDERARAHRGIRQSVEGEQSLDTQDALGWQREQDAQAHRNEQGGLGIRAHQARQVHQSHRPDRAEPAGQQGITPHGLAIRVDRDDTAEGADGVARRARPLVVTRQEPPEQPEGVGHADAAGRPAHADRSVGSMTGIVVTAPTAATVVKPVTREVSIAAPRADAPLSAGSLAGRRPAPESESPIVHVTIGRIDVVAQVPPEPSRRRPSARPPSVALGDYLRGRREGSR